MNRFILKSATRYQPITLAILTLAWAIVTGVVGQLAFSADIVLPQPSSIGDFRTFDRDRAELGRLLFYDRVLSGNYDTSCATCHHHDRASSDGAALAGTKSATGGRTHDSRYDESTPSPLHAPALFNLGANEFRTLFHNGRVADHPDKPGEFQTPAGKLLPTGINHVVAAQSLFPLTDPGEMAGQPGENEIADAVADGKFSLALQRITQRVRNLEEYLPHFRKTYSDIATSNDIEIQHIANSIGDFVISEWRSDNSPFDRFVMGENAALTAGQNRGLSLFYGKAECSSCHSGIFQTDHQFYSLALPQIGLATKKNGLKLDRGRMAISGKAEGAFAFRTPSLRNVVQTAPYGHNGAYKTLSGIIRQHLNPAQQLAAFGVENTLLPNPSRALVKLGSADELLALANSNDVTAVTLTQNEISQLIAFLSSLTDPSSLNGRLGKPTEVPSSLLLD